jgi:hypothetical protein
VYRADVSLSIGLYAQERLKTSYRGKIRQANAPVTTGLVGVYSVQSSSTPGGSRLCRRQTLN